MNTGTTRPSAYSDEPNLPTPTGEQAPVNTPKANSGMVLSCCALRALGLGCPSWLQDAYIISFRSMECKIAFLPA